MQSLKDKMKSYWKAHHVHVLVRRPACVKITEDNPAE
jgi:hypothetical protein